MENRPINRNSSFRIILLMIITTGFNLVVFAQPSNDNCSGAISITSSISGTCVSTNNVSNATLEASNNPATCSGSAAYDVWYTFVAQTTNPTITLSGIGKNFKTPGLQLLSGVCGSLVSKACVSGAAPSLNATGLVIGSTYFVRVYSTTGPAPTSSAGYTICITDPPPPPSNDNCTGAITLTSSTTCTNTTGTLAGATVSVGVPAGCGNAASADVWYQFVAQTAYPTITLSSIGTSLSSAFPTIQILSGTCGTLSQVACATASSITPGGAGLTVGSTYYVRITTASATGTPSGSNWGFNICIKDPTATSTVEFSRAYINVSKSNGGGTVNPGDTLEIRSTLVVKAGTVDSLALFDTLYHGNGLRYVPGSLALRTNEGIVYSSMTDAYDADNGWIAPTGLDTSIQINYGTGSNSGSRGNLSNTSKPSFYGSTCIMMVTYRVVVYAGYGSLINFRTGRMTARDQSTGIITNKTFVPDNIIVYSSPGLCPNAVSPTNAIGVEANGTFGTASNPTPLVRNRAASPYVPSYIYTIFSGTGVGGPQDYYYTVANNTSTTFTTSQAWGKPDGTPSHRLFGYWDIIGDHTGASNTARGNPPCDTTQPVSATNPCGYMLLINSAYKTDTAFQYTVTNLCPNTYYEISGWFRNMCAKCSCDSLGNGVYSGSLPNAAYRAATPGDSSGVRPNIAFDVNGTDYYSTGNLTYIGTQTGGLDSNNKWVKKGFTYLTGASQTSFTLTLRNSAPGGGGNDWALDDIGVNTCLPNMRYSPTLSPTVCQGNPITIRDTVTSYFNNYTNYKWQYLPSGSSTWTDIAGTTNNASPYSVSGGWQYVASYTIPPSSTTTSNNGDQYRVITATTSSNLGNASCQVTDGYSQITLTVQTVNCGVPLSVDLLSFNGKLVNDQSSLSWTTSREDEPVQFQIERSNDGTTFEKIATVNGRNNSVAETNYYSFTDPLIISDSKWYRIHLISATGKEKYSRIIQLSKKTIDLELTNVINPFSDQVIFDITSSHNTQVFVDLVDMQGRVIRTKTYLLYPGVNNLSINNTQALPVGIYSMIIRDNDKVITRTVMKNR